MKKIAILVYLFLSLSLIVTCSAKENEEVTIGYSRLRISLPVFVAYQNNYFKDNDLQVELEMFDTAQPLMDALCGGKIDIAGYTALPITFNAQIKSRKNLLYTTLLMEDNSHPISMFIVPKDSPIKTFDDLKGKTIGILPTFAYKAWLEMVLKNHDFKKPDFIIQHVSPAMTPAALKSGSVDAMFTNDPAITTSIQQGVARLLFDKAVVPENMWSPLPFASFNINKEYADKHPQIIKKIVISLNQAIAFINSNQDEAKKIMGKFLPKAQQPFVEHYPDALFVQSDKVELTELNKIQKAYNELGITKAELDLKELLYK